MGLNVFNKNIFYVFSGLRPVLSPRRRVQGLAITFQAGVDHLRGSYT